MPRKKLPKMSGANQAKTAQDSDIYFGVEIETVVKMSPEVFHEFPKSDRFEDYCDAQSLIFVEQLRPKLKSQLFLFDDDYHQWQFFHDPSIEDDGVMQPSGTFASD